MTARPFQVYQLKGSSMTRTLSNQGYFRGSINLGSPPDRGRQPQPPLLIGAMLGATRTRSSIRWGRAADSEVPREPLFNDRQTRVATSRVSKRSSRSIRRVFSPDPIRWVTETDSRKTRTFGQFYVARTDLIRTYHSGMC